MFFPKPCIPEAYYTHPSQVADAYATLADPMKRQKYESWMKVGFCNTHGHDILMFSRV